ncbi:pyridoxal phosphate-dependent aminotransferase family protein [Panacibacter ginsenosidivorans]|uniref:Pyridoxal phosphate-dependent aminotransferase family protein n=1 Tax=Panacibacter ginsenosidivorans TaxID=1813871 RepID=A0A5B8VBW1_9BACT|nr:aminotransferase class I/II-fold pyridoxal phosphate-dependent enzyme [Panacibacter ginsenosidivorans]QEC68515.1 pyridoxal phosphate-dependent aminotransferase family protein [Panacibacter ginsenosidivorans]
MNFFAFDAIPGRTALIKGEEYLFFSGYSYLGMQQVPEFAALVKEGIDKYGWLFPSSRISNTRLEIFEEAELLLSAITGMEASVIVASGYIAGRIATAAFADTIVNLHPSHPAIQRNNDHQHTNIFAVDSVETLNASVTDFSFVTGSTISKTIIVDDSHGIGLIGDEGEGIISRLPQNNYTQYILTYSLSKAFHINAGAISCSKEMAANYKKDHAYTSATAPSPALLYAFIKGQYIYAAQRQKLQNNRQYFQQLVKDLTCISYHPELPVFILPENINEQKLFGAGIIISSFAYPDVQGKRINRIVLSALHTKEDLELLANLLHKIL